jgi:hypothetical protein
MAMIVVDASSLAQLERSHGIEGCSAVSKSVSSVVLDACSPYLEADDLVVTGAIGGDEAVVLFFRWRCDDQFYREVLDQVSNAIVGSLGNAPLQ